MNFLKGKSFAHVEEVINTAKLFALKDKSNIQEKHLYLAINELTLEKVNDDVMVG